MERMKSLAPRAGRPRRYEPEELRRAVERYFRRIGRTRIVTEEVMTGELDRYGHPVFMSRPVLLEDGKTPMTEWQWLKPPTVGGLCAALGVHRSTWEKWTNVPELREIVEWARDVMHGYLEEELLTREGKNARGVEFALSANYGVSEKKTVEITGAGVDLSRMTDEELQNLIQEENACTKTTT